MLLVSYLPARHQIVDTEIAHHLRRRLDRDDLFTYRHRLTGRWEIARWTDPSHRTFEELLGMNSLSEFDRASVFALVAWHNATLPSKRTVEAEFRGMEQAEIRQQTDELQESRDTMRFIGRKLGSDDPFWKRDGLPVAMEGCG